MTRKHAYSTQYTLIIFLPITPRNIWFKTPGESEDDDSNEKYIWSFISGKQVIIDYYTNQLIIKSKRDAVNFYWKVSDKFIYVY